MLRREEMAKERGRWQKKQRVDRWWRDGSHSQGIIFSANRCNDLTIANRCETYHLLASQINRPAHFTPPSPFAVPSSDQALNAKYLSYPTTNFPSVPALLDPVETQLWARMHPSMEVVVIVTQRRKERLI